MSWRLACDAPDLVRAVAPSHGILWGTPLTVQTPKCDLSRKVSVLAFGGLQDPLQAGLSVAASATRWRGFYGHKDEPVTTYSHDSTICKSTSGGGANVTMCQTATGPCSKHAYPGSSAVGFTPYACPAEIHSTEQILDFFAANSAGPAPPPAPPPPCVDKDISCPALACGLCGTNIGGCVTNHCPTETYVHTTTNCTKSGQKALPQQCNYHCHCTGSQVDVVV